MRFETDVNVKGGSTSGISPVTQTGLDLKCGYLHDRLTLTAIGRLSHATISLLFNPLLLILPPELSFSLHPSFLINLNSLKRSTPSSTIET